MALVELVNRAAYRDAAAQMGARLQQEQAASARDAGYYKTTPFFISYMEPAEKLRRAGCDWQKAMACWASGDAVRAAELAKAALAGEPANLYATLIADGV